MDHKDLAIIVWMIICCIAFFLLAPTIYLALLAIGLGGSTRPTKEDMRDRKVMMWYALWIFIMCIIDVVFLIKTFQMGHIDHTTRNNMFIGLVTATFFFPVVYGVVVSKQQPTNLAQ